MPVLTKPKWENMARNLARGMTQPDAYEQAGFKRDATNASRLANNPVILERVQEIQEEREKILSGPNAYDPEADDGEGEQVAITQEWVLERLAANVISAQTVGNHSAANKALEMLGQYLGMSFADKTAPAKGDNHENPGLGTGNTFNVLSMTEGLAQMLAPPAPIKDITPEPGDA